MNDAIFETVAERAERERVERERASSAEESARETARISKQNREAGARAGADWERDQAVQAERKAAGEGRERADRLAEARARAESLRRVVEAEPERVALEGEIRNLEQQLAWKPLTRADADGGKLTRLIECRALLSLWPERKKSLHDELARAVADVKELETSFEAARRTFNEATASVARLFKKDERSST